MEQLRALTIDQAADALGVDQAAVEALIQRGSLATVSIGDSVRIPHAALARFLGTRPPRLRRALPLLFAGAVALGVSGAALLANASLSTIDPLAPQPIPYHGYLERSGAPVNDTLDLTFQLFESATAPTPLWQERQTSVAINAGVFDVQLGSVTPISDRVLGEPALYVGVVVHGDGDVTLANRQRLLSVPYSRRAGNGVPPGTIVPFAGEAVPEGWLLCDGTALDGEDPLYAELRLAIGTAWGNGTAGTGASTSTDFNVPDLRGAFLRGVDRSAGRDPEAASRTQPLTPTGAPMGGNDRDRVGSWQTDQYRSHAHPHRDSGHAHNPAVVGIPWGSGYLGRGNQAFSGGGGAWFGTDGASFPTAAANANIQVLAAGGTETRPMNAAVNYIIRL